MAANKNSKLKLLCIQRMLEEETDADHGLSMAEIIQRLAEEGIAAERKSIYRDFEILREFGLDIKTYQRNPVEYAIEHRDFTLSELMLMVDAVASSKFLTVRQANILLANIKSLASLSQQEKLDRSIHVEGRIRSKTECVFEAVDIIHSAIRKRKKITFQYLHYGIDGKRHPAHGGRRYVVTPVGVSYDGGYYYVTCWSDTHGRFNEYRIDRMDHLAISTEDATRNESIAQFSFNKNTYEYFGRFDGPQTVALLAVQDDKVEIITDRFGSHAELIPEGAYAKAKVSVRVSPQFFGWIAGLDGAVRIIGPQNLVDDYKAYLQSLIDGC